LTQIILAKRLNNVLQQQIRAEKKNLSSSQIKHEMKNKILELYLNYVFLGNNSYGVEAASKIYFNKPAKDLTIMESAILASIPKAPTRYDPYKSTSLL
jgi:penicillin-binding protein, 1A family